MFCIRSMKRITGVILFGVIVVGIVGLVVGIVDNETKTASTTSGNTNTGSGGTATGTTGDTGGKITLSELAIHNKQSDCWVVYKGKVYDLTSWLPIHPGSPEAILPYCGNTGFEKAFTDKHGTSKVEKLMKEGVYKGEFQ